MAHDTTSQDAMTQGAAIVEHAASRIQEHLANLRFEIDTTIGGSPGAATGALLPVHQAFETQARKINTALRQMHGSLLATGGAYGSQETDQSLAPSDRTGPIDA